MESLYTQAFAALELARQHDPDNSASITTSSSLSSVEKATKAYREAIRLFNQIIEEETDKDKVALVLKNVSSLSVRCEKLDELQMEYLFQEQDMIDDARAPQIPPTHVADPGLRNTSSSLERDLNLPLPPSSSLSISQPSSSSSSALVNHVKKEQAESLLREALTLDEKDQLEHTDKVISLYTAASEMYIMYLKDNNSTLHEKERSSLQSKVSKILDRITHLKGSNTVPPIKTPSIAPTTIITASQKDDKDRVPLDAMELQVLKASSILNGKIYQPWLEGEEHVEQFRYDQSWCDPEGLPCLSQKHLDVGAVWKRPKEFLPALGFSGSPRMAENVSPLSIVQDIVGDCSFVCSLCIAAEMQQRFNKRLITSIIYPQNSRGAPVYNPFGKYLVKLFFNGVVRKVTVDDRLPYDPHNNRLLCATSTTHDLYVAIVEKAYMKLHGGYNFPGSNSGIDLYCLTGWIPEKLYFDEDGDHSQSSDRAWQRLLSAHKFGDCLVTIATFSEMSEADEATTGLVRGHAYAVLDIKEAGKLRMLKVKNPWSHRPWRGKFSNVDKHSWTVGLKDALGIKNQTDFDDMERDGLFWIEFMDAKRYFKRFYLNWNPHLFSYRFAIHDTWFAKQSPKNDRYYIGSNPQYTFKLDYGTCAGKPSGQMVSVWILISKHMNNSNTKKFKHFQDSESFDQSKYDDDDDEYMTCHVFNDTDGKRVYAPRKRYVSGLYTNDPHNLIRFDVDPTTICKDSGTVAYTFVLSRLNNSRDLSYTLTVLSTRPFLFNRTPTLPHNQIPIQDAWKENTSSGGSFSHESFNINPQYRLVVHKKPSEIHLQMFYPIDIQGSISVFPSSAMVPVGVTDSDNITVVPDRTDSYLPDEEMMSSGPYCTGYCHCSGVLPVGSYNVIFSNYHSGMVGNFKGVCASTSSTVSLEAIPPEGAGFYCMRIHGEWSITNGTAVGCKNYGKYLDNPYWRIDIPVASTKNNDGHKGEIFLGARLRILDSTPTPMNVSIYKITDEAIEGTMLPVSNAKKGPQRAMLSSANAVYINLSCGVKIPITRIERSELTRMVQGKEFTDDDDGIRRVIKDVVFSHEDDVYYARYIIKGEKDIKKNHDYTILRQVFDMAREGGDDWVEDRFYKGKKIE